MKTLYLIRHAKSSWKNLSLDDFDRPLNKRGKRDAPFMAKKLREQGILPDLIITSPAKRARKTAEEIAEGIGYSKKKIVKDKSIYEATESKLLSLIRSTHNKNGSLMIFGHNPELTALSNMLSDQYIYNIPTTGISCIRFSQDRWKDISEKTGIQVFFDYPKRYTKE